MLALVIGKRLRPIVAYIAEAYLQPSQTSNLYLFVKIINGYKDEFKTVKHLRWSLFHKFLQATEANLKSCQTYKMECFAKIVKSQKPLTIYAKTSILDTSQGSEVLMKWLPSKFDF